MDILLIHGLQTSKGRCDEFADFQSLNLNDSDLENTFDELYTKLSSNKNINDAYKFYTYRYPTNVPIKEASDALWNLLKNREDINNPVIIAHSMGGVVVRKLLSDYGDDKIRALITLATPHEGTPLVDFLLNTQNTFNQFSCPTIVSDFAYAIVDIAKLFQASIFPNTPGLRDLKVGSPLINSLSQGSRDKIFTFGGSLSIISAITDLGNLQDNITNIKY